MDSSSTTRITDLPENITIQQVQLQQQQGSQLPPTISMTQSKSNQLDSQSMNYLPMNIHPNPYGPPSLPSQQQTSIPQQYHEQLSQIPPQRLPSRDIPMDTLGYTQDQEIQSNYIPPSHQKDYVREYESTTEKNMREYKEKKRNLNTLDYWITELQFPLLISILFFLFQLPILNTLFYKNFKTIFFREDGNINLYGLLAKTMLFGSSMYILGKIGQFVV
jgi:hypothetical protein